VAGADQPACAQIRNRGGDGKVPRRVDAPPRVANASSRDEPDFELAGRERERLRKGGGGLVRMNAVSRPGRVNPRGDDSTISPRQQSLSHELSAALLGTNKPRPQAQTRSVRRGVPPTKQNKSWPRRREPSSVAQVQLSTEAGLRVASLLGYLLGLPQLAFASPSALGQDFVFGASKIR
jgi:hypothetical protein